MTIDRTPTAGQHRRRTGGRLPLRTGAVVVALMAASTAVSAATAPHAGASVPPPPAGWTQVFADDFNGAAGSGVNTGDWLYDVGTSYPGGAANWGTGEVETMTSSTQNVFQDGGGHLVIKPIRDGGGNWTSGRIETQRTDLAAPAGGKLRFEASLQQPNVSGGAAAGYWPAFWSLGAAARPVGATNWPGVGEIDVMEDINGRSSEFATLHCGVAPGGPCNEFTGLGSGERACGGCQTGFHTYAMELDRSVSPEQIRWYLDGNNFFTVNAGQVDANTWNNATHHGFFMILNVAMGGSFPGAFGGGPTGATQSGVPMVVDYVAAYTQGGGAPPPPPPPSGSTGPITGIAGKCVDVRAANTANGTPVQLYDCNGTNAQQWTVGGGTIRALGKCLDVSGGGTTNATPVQLWDCNGGGAQTWRLQTNGALLNPQSGRCLDDPNSNTANSTQLQIWDCNGTNAQQWNPPAGPITGNGGKCVDVRAANTANGTPVQLYDCNGTNAQQWAAGGTIRALGKCLDVSGGGTANATVIQLWDCNGTGAQNWQSRPDGTLVNPQSGRCLDDPAGNTTNGTQLIIWDCNAGPNQQWTLS